MDFVISKKAELDGCGIRCLSRLSKGMLFRTIRPIKNWLQLLINLIEEEQDQDCCDSYEIQQNFSFKKRASKLNQFIQRVNNQTHVFQICNRSELIVKSRKLKLLVLEHPEKIPLNLNSFHYLAYKDHKNVYLIYLDKSPPVNPDRFLFQQDEFAKQPFVSTDDNQSREQPRHDSSVLSAFPRKTGFLAKKQTLFNSQSEDQINIQPAIINKTQRKASRQKRVIQERRYDYSRHTYCLRCMRPNYVNGRFCSKCQIKDAVESPIKQKINFFSNDKKYFNNYFNKKYQSPIRNQFGQAINSCFDKDSRMKGLRLGSTERVGRRWQDRFSPERGRARW